MTQPQQNGGRGGLGHPNPHPDPPHRPKMAFFLKNSLFSGEAGQEDGNSASVAAAEHCLADAKGDKLQKELPIFRNKKNLSASI